MTPEMIWRHVVGAEARLSVSRVTCGRPIHGGVNSGRNVTITKTRSVDTRSKMTSKASRVVGSIQCASS